MSNSHIDFYLALDEIHLSLLKLKQTSIEQQKILSSLIKALVKLGQEQRVLRNYAVSDAIRDMLAKAGITLIQGTAGYTYDKIPEVLKGRPIDDSWSFKQ